MPSSSSSHAHYKPRKSDGTGNVELPSGKDLRNIIADRVRVADADEKQRSADDAVQATSTRRAQRNMSSKGNNNNDEENSPQRNFLRPAAVVAAERRAQRLASLANSTSTTGSPTVARGSTNSLGAIQEETKQNTSKGIRTRTSSDNNSLSRAQSRPKPKSTVGISSDTAGTGAARTGISISTSRPEGEKKLVAKENTNDNSKNSNANGIWKAAYDKNRRRAYYYHTVTKEVTWTKPADFHETSNVFRPANNAASGRAPYITAADNTKEQNDKKENVQESTDTTVATSRPTLKDVKGTVALTSSKRVDPNRWSNAFASPDPKSNKNRRASVTYSTPRHQQQKEQQPATSVISPRNVSGRIETVLSQVLPNDNIGRKTLLAKYSGRQDDLLRALVELRSEMVQGMTAKYEVEDVTAKMIQIKSRRGTGGRAAAGKDINMSYPTPVGGNGAHVLGSPTPRKRTSPSVNKGDQVGISRTFSGDSDGDYLEQGARGDDDNNKTPYGKPSVRRWKHIMFWSIGAFVLCLVGAIIVSPRSNNGSEATQATMEQPLGGIAEAGEPIMGVEEPTLDPRDALVASTSDNGIPSAKPTYPHLDKNSLKNLGTGAGLDAQDWNLDLVPPTDPPSARTTLSPTPAPSPKATYPTHVPTPRPTYLDGYEHVVGRIDSVKCSPRADADVLPMLMSVTNREVVIGCHSFEEYLSPRYETVFILNEDFVRTWEIDKLVKSANCDQTLGAHILMLDNQGGELLGRRLSVDFLEKENMAGPKIEFLGQTNCDVHPLPKGHRHYMTLDQMMQNMMRDFRLIRAQREPHRYPEIPKASFNLVDNLVGKHNDWLRFEILAMGPLLFEDFPSMLELPLETHGHDVCEWGNSGGLYARPQVGNWPWLCDVHEFTENHILLFDVEKLMRPQVRHHYLEVPRKLGIDGFASDTRTTPRIAAQHELTIVVNRDVYAHQNFGHGPNALNGYEVKDLDLARIHNWVTLSTNRGPKPVYDTWNGFNSEIIPEPYVGGTSIDFIRGHFKSDGVWFPDPGSIYHQALNTCVKCRLMVDSLFRLFGYEVLQEDGENLSYCLKGTYPANIYVMVSDELGYKTPDDSWEFLRTRSSLGIRRYIALGSVKTSDMRAMSPEQRMLLVSKTATVTEIFGPSEIKKREYIASRGRFKRDKANREICGAPDQDRNTACGYLEPSDFVLPYPHQN